MIDNSVIKQLVEKYDSIWALGYMASLSYWDTETYMPEDAVEFKSKAHGKIDLLIQSLYLEPWFQALLSEALKQTNLNDIEAGIVRVLNRDMATYTKLPAAFVEARSVLQNEATAVWKEAKSTNDFPLFQPYLERIIEMCLQKSEIMWYVEHPYDVHLDEYEEWLTTKEVDAFFVSLKEWLLPLFASVQEKYKRDVGIWEMWYDQEVLRRINQSILDDLWFDARKQRLDIAVHPFCEWFTNKDVRMATRYEKDFFNTIFGSIHEYWHGLYETQYDDILNMTPVAWWSSLIIHESQSRFWENCLGRSKTFISKHYEKFLSLHDDFAAFTVEDFYSHVNHIKPNLIRVDADELYYHIHVLIRFEIEKWLMEKTIKVADLPEVRNAKYKEYLWVDVPNDSLGVLQDVHWSFGLFGYFPTYSMGTALSIIWKDALEKELWSIEVLMETQDWISSIRGRLKEHIHQFGSVYTLSQLLKRENLQFSAQPLLDYLRKKYC